MTKVRLMPITVALALIVLISGCSQPSSTIDNEPILENSVINGVPEDSAIRGVPDEVSPDAEETEGFEGVIFPSNAKIEEELINEIDENNGLLAPEMERASSNKKKRDWVGCEDSDGSDFFQQGTVNAELRIRGNEQTYTFSDKCAGNEKRVIEFYCDGNKPKAKKAGCDFGCGTGACVKGADSSIFILIDQSTHNKLRKEILNLQEDIVNDLGVKVAIHSGDWGNPGEVRELLKNGYLESDLEGAIFIGDIAYVYFGGHSEYPTMLSDYYYMNLDREFADEYRDGMFEFVPNILKNDFDKFEKEIWISRIKSPKTGENAIEQIKSYLNRNHEYRTGNLKFNSKLLFSSTTKIFDQDYSEEAHNDFAKEIVENIGAYDFESEVDVIYNSCNEPEDCPIKQDLLASFQQPYESLYYNGHGASSAFILNQVATITSGDIENNSPQIGFYAFESCSVGHFAADESDSGGKEYLAGHFLFDGQGMGVFAFTEPVMTDGTKFVRFFKALNLGMPVKEVIKQTFHNIEDNLILTFFGDPTLTMRQKPATHPTVTVSETNFDLGEINVGETQAIPVNVTNEGESDLEFDLFSHYISLNGEYTGGTSVQHSVMGPISISPGQTRQIIINITPFKSGNINGKLVKLTNDPNNPFLYINYQANAT